MTTLIPKYDLGATGAVNRSINLKLSDVTSILDFGADQTGVADSTTAIQNAINNALLTGNGTVYIPTGKYKVTSLNVYPTGTKTLVMIGDGALDSVFSKYDTSTTPIFNMSGTAGGGSGAGVTTYPQFKNFGITGIATADGIYADTLYGCIFEGLSITGCNVGFRSLGSLGFSIKSCIFSGNQIGFYADQSPVNNGYSNLISVNDTRFISNSQNAAYLNKGQNITFNSCGFELNATGTGATIYVAATYADETSESSLAIKNCWFEANVTNGAPIYTVCTNTWIDVSDCNFYDTAPSSLTFNGIGNSILLNNCYGNDSLNIGTIQEKVSINNCLFPSHSIVATNYSIVNLQDSGSGIQNQTTMINSLAGTISVPTATATTITTGGLSQVYLVTAFISGGGANNTASCLVVEGVVNNASFGSGISISVDSSYHIQVTQTTGVTQNVQYTILRLK